MPLHSRSNHECSGPTGAGVAFADICVSCSSGRFRAGGSNKTSNPPRNGNGSTNSQSSSPTTLQSNQSSSSLAPRMPPLPTSPSLASTLSMEDRNTSSSSNDADPLAAYNLPRPRPLWLDNSYSKHIVKGNFMTLSARPKTVESGEWIAHQGEPRMLR